MSKLSELRLTLAQARADLRTAQDWWHTAKLRAEIGLINEHSEHPEMIGKSEDMRRRSFDAVIEIDQDCQDAQAAVRELQKKVDLLTAELDSAIDASKERDMDLRERNIVVLERWHTEAS